MHTPMQHIDFSSKSTKFNPYFSWHNYRQHKLAKVGIRSCRFAKEYVLFVHAYVDICNYPAGIVFA